MKVRLGSPGRPRIEVVLTDAQIQSVVNKERTLQQLATELGVPYTRVQRAVVRKVGPLKKGCRKGTSGRVDVERNQRIFAMKKAGKLKSEIATAMGISQVRVAFILRRGY